METIIYETELNQILFQKKKANSLINTNLSESLAIYEELKNHIEKLKDDSKENDKENPVFIEINNQYKAVLSNIAMVYHRKGEYKTSVKYDRRVIALDKLFDKSYARLIDSYMKLDNFTLARHFYTVMKNIFSEEIMKRYQDIIRKIKEQIEEKDSYINSLKSLFSTK